MVDRCVGLDRVDEVVAGSSARGSSAGSPRRPRPRANRRSRTGCRSRRPAAPTTTRLESPSGTGIERVQGRVDPDHADVVVEVVADDVRRHPVAVRELDVDGVRGAALPERDLRLARVRDHVRVRQDQALWADDEARSPGPRSHRARCPSPKYETDRHDPGRAGAEDLRPARSRCRRAASRRRPGPRRPSRRRLGDDDGLRRGAAEPARGLADGQHGGAAEHGSDEGEGSSRARAHRRPTVAAPPRPCADLAQRERLRVFTFCRRTRPPKKKTARRGPAWARGPGRPR